MKEVETIKFYNNIKEGGEVQFSAFKDILDYRIESEYFLKKYIEVENTLSNVECFPFSKCFSFKNGKAYASEAFFKNVANQDSTTDVFVAKIGDVTNKTDISQWDSITDSEFEDKSGEYLSNGDVLMTLTGDPPDVGSVCIISSIDAKTSTDSSIKKITWNQRVAKVEIKDRKLITSQEFAYALLSSKYCRLQMERFAKGIRQRNLGNEALKRVKIPHISVLLQEQVKKLIEESSQYSLDSYKCFNSALDEYNKIIQIADWQPSKENTSVRLYTETEKAARLDAEYYQIKFDELFKILSKTKCKTVGEITKLHKSIEPGSEHYQDNGIPFIRVANLSKFEITSSKVFLSPDEFKLSELRPQVGNILLSKDGSVGIALCVEDDPDYITSGAIIALEIIDKNFIPEYVALVLNSITTQMQAERTSNGAVILHWKPDEIKKVLIPELSLDEQNSIAEKYSKAISYRKLSRQKFLEAVMAINNEIEHTCKN